MQKLKVPNPTVDDYVALKKEWIERGVNIDTVSEQEIQFYQDLFESINRSTGLTKNELTLITQCRIHDISKDIGKFARLLTKQQKERDELLKEIEHNKIDTLN